MNNTFTFIPKKTLLLITILVVVIGLLGLFTLINQPKKVTPIPEPVISQQVSAITPLQKTNIGKTITEDIDKTYSDASKQTLANGGIKYLISSGVNARPDEVVFVNNVAQFERTILIGRQTESNFVKMSAQILKFGPAEKVMKGSKFYGAHMETHIYSSKGLAFIVNPNSDEVYEIQTFTPTTLENYLSNYGEDIHEYPEIKE